MEIVFVPGLNCTGALFAPQIAALADRHRCHVADHGAADSLEAIAASILASAPDRFALLGLSMGGYVAYEILRQQPQRVSRLALLDTRARLDTPEDAERRRQTIALAEGGRFEELHGILWPRLVHPSRHSDKALESVVTTMMAETGPERFVRQQTAVLNRADYRPLLAEIDVPTLVLVGGDDEITPPAHARELHAAIAASRYVEVAACGHLSSLERPSEVSAALEEWLGS